jgi:hypothetical protein
MQACRNRHPAHAPSDSLLASTNARLDMPSTSIVTLHIANVLSASRALPLSLLMVLCTDAGIAPLLSQSRPQIPRIIIPSVFIHVI